MFGRLWALIKGKRRVGLRALYEFAFPIICGIAWGIVAWRRDAEPYAAISLGAAAFFFIFSMQGQFLRMNKNVRDEENADEWRTQFSSLREGVDELRRQRPGLPGTPPAPLPRPEAQSFIDQARRSLDLSLFYPAALTASIGFEQELKTAAASLDFDIRRPLAHVARQFGEMVGDKELVAWMLTLVRLRNGLVHPRERAVLDEEEASQLVNGFADGIEAIKTIHAKCYGAKIAPAVSY